MKWLETPELSLASQIYLDLKHCVLSRVLLFFCYTVACSSLTGTITDLEFTTTGKLRNISIDDAA